MRSHASSLASCSSSALAYLPLAALAYLLVLLLFVRFRAAGAWGAWLAAVTLCVPALFTKEIVVTLPVTLLGFDRSGGRGASQGVGLDP